MFLYFKYCEDNPKFLEEKMKSKKKNMNTDIEELEQAEIEDDENLMLNVIEDYKTEFGVKKVNTNTKKFKTFFEEWKSSN